MMSSLNEKLHDTTALSRSPLTPRNKTLGNFSFAKENIPVSPIPRTGDKSPKHEDLQEFRKKLDFYKQQMPTERTDH